MNVVILDEELPYPPNSGKRLRTLNLIRRLACRHQITYLCHRHPDAQEAREAEIYLQDHGINVKTIDQTVPTKSGFSFYGRLAANLFSPLPYSVQSHCHPTLQRAIRQLQASGAVDLWHVEWTPYAQGLRGRVPSPWVVMAHNIESQIWQRYYDTERQPWKRWYIGRQLQKYRRFEREIFALADRVIVVSDSDADLARRWFGVTKLSLVSNGVDLNYFHPCDCPRDFQRILFLGSLDWRPNLDAVKLLLEDIFPRVLARRPEVHLQLVGRNPPGWLYREVARHQNVSLHANVTDVRPFLWQCGLMAVPLRIGGGSRLKILEALACACPVVSTRIGSEGLHLCSPREILEVPEVSEMAGKILESLGNPTSAVGMAREGCKRVCEEYSWDPLAEKLGAIWESQFRPAPSRESSPPLSFTSRGITPALPAS